MVANFPTELLARRHPVLDRIAENALGGRLHEPPLAPVTDHGGQVDLARRTRFQAHSCQPDCAPFWSVPDSVFALHSHGAVEEGLLAAGVDPGGLDFAGYLEQHLWAVQLPRQPRYWHSYRMFGVAARAIRIRRSRLTATQCVRP